jgi:membrane-anchored protein YejM (alkaline phosphatase superfamily)
MNEEAKTRKWVVKASKRRRRITTENETWNVCYNRMGSGVTYSSDSIKDSTWRTEQD